MLAQSSSPRRPLVSPAAALVADQPDAHLFALASELEAAARPYLAYDRHNHVTPADPDLEEALAHARALYGAVKDVSERIFVFRPQTIAGLLVIAHAATVVAEERWDEEPQHVGHDGRLLRLLSNGLFRLAGVDWRGHPLAGAPAARSSPDADLSTAAAHLDLLDAEIAALSAAHPGTDLEEIPGAREREGRRDAVLRDLCRSPAEGTWGMAAKAQALLSRDLMGDAVRHGELAVSLAHDVERLAAPSQFDADPIYAAIEASRAAFNNHVVVCQSDAAVLPGGDELCRDAGLASHAAWRALLKVRPTTFEGVKALAAYVPEFIEDGAWDDDRDAETLFRTIASVCSDCSSRPSEALKDASLIRLVEVAIAEEHAAKEKLAASDGDMPPGTFRRSCELVELVTDAEARTLAGIVAKSRLLLIHIPAGTELDGDWRCEALALSIARDASQLKAASVSDCADPVFAAIAAFQIAHADLVNSICREGNADEAMIECNDLAFEALLETRPTTEAGMLASLKQIVFEMVYVGKGCVLPKEWLEDAGRIVNGGQPITDTTLAPAIGELVAAG